LAAVEEGESGRAVGVRDRCSMWRGRDTGFEEGSIGVLRRGVAGGAEAVPARDLSIARAEVPLEVDPAVARATATGEVASRGVSGSRRV